MILTAGQSWLLLLAVFTFTILAIWISTGGLRARARRDKQIAHDLDELHEHERTRAAIARTQARSNVRIGRPTPPPAKDTTND